jgi:8-oxo-dGTP pyrophosphatase MutT (NUDIX family)
VPNGLSACTVSAVTMIDGNQREEQLASEIARIQEIIRSPHIRNAGKRTRGTPAIRPRDAATIIIVDGKPGDHRILMGKRHQSLTFMPGALVFPGGSVDRTDGSIPAADALSGETERKILSNLRGRPSSRRARGLAMAAIRELCEETGLLVGRPGKADTHHRDWEPFLREGIVPSIGNLSLLSRAITPPGPPRRFDTWFFVTRSDNIAFHPEGGFSPSGELEKLQWITPKEAIAGSTREITRVMIVELMHRLERDPALDPAYPVPFYHRVGNRFHKEII